uniref:ATP synthase subunit a n=1 Tax=Thulinius sp. DVL-2010 TaxID=867920 RepID=F8RJB4_9BILA|nr:ATP synthase F0 subunit 6 [Thulinius sp. DVL-2010]ADK97596.1 ATP synthase F0 subunit 6 [Thulinius sp. DVL-2010]
MMNSLFESFDPLLSAFNFNLLAYILPILFPLSKNISFHSNRFSTLTKSLNSYLFSEFSASTSSAHNKMKTLFLASIFYFILLLNLTGLIPFVYTMTSQMMNTLSLALPFWLGFILFSMLNNTNHFLSHLVPLSTPLLLSQFMTLIESVSQIIRPITLSVRLCANMTAGHILMALSSQPIFLLNFFSSILMILLILEIAVAFIQSYVFTMLLSMYISETL